MAPIKILEELPLALFFLFWYLVDTMFSLINYVVWVRYNEDMLGINCVRSYLAFVIIGSIVYFSITGVFFLWSMKYHENKKDERNKLIAGVVFVYFFSDFPIFIIEFYIAYYWGYHHTIQALSFMLTIVSWAFGSATVWFSYMWRMARCLQLRSGGPLYSIPASAQDSTAMVPHGAGGGGGDHSRPPLSPRSAIPPSPSHTHKTLIGDTSPGGTVI